VKRNLLPLFAAVFVGRSIAVINKDHPGRGCGCLLALLVALVLAGFLFESSTSTPRAKLEACPAPMVMQGDRCFPNDLQDSDMADSDSSARRGNK
jgi:hypothetical protein